MKPLLPALGSTLALALAACVPQPKPIPPVQVRPTSAPVSTPSPAPAAVNWLDEPASEGDWYYRSDGEGSIALFGEDRTEADFMIACDRARRTIRFSRASESSTPVPMRIRTETSERLLTARPDGGALPSVVTSLPASDRLLDAIALSKGRFAVEVGGVSPLYMPSWAEVTRVIEDCR